MSWPTDMFGSLGNSSAKKDYIPANGASFRKYEDPTVKFVLTP